MDQFKSWVAKQDFSSCRPDENTQRGQRLTGTKAHFNKTLMCGFVAVNHILSALGLSNITEQDMESTAQEMAVRESNIVYSMDPSTVLDLAADPRGNYAADTLLHMLQQRSGFGVDRWRPEQPISSCVILVGSGDHWQAVLMDRDKQWFVLERIGKYPIQNIAAFLRSKLANGAVYEIGILENLPNSKYLDAQQRPRQRHATTRSPQEGDVEEPPRKKRHQVVFQVGTTTQGSQGGRHLSKLSGSNLPLNLQDPGFQFERPPQPDVSPSHSAPETWFQNLPGEVLMETSLMDVSVDALTPAGEEVDQPRRSSRVKVPATYYQSDEVERQDKALREEQGRSVNISHVVIDIGDDNEQ